MNLVRLLTLLVSARWEYPNIWWYGNHEMWIFFWPRSIEFHPKLAQKYHQKFIHMTCFTLITYLLLFDRSYLQPCLAETMSGSRKLVSRTTNLRVSLNCCRTHFLDPVYYIQKNSRPHICQSIFVSIRKNTYSSTADQLWSSSFQRSRTFWSQIWFGNTFRICPLNHKDLSGLCVPW